VNARVYMIVVFVIYYLFYSAAVVCGLILDRWADPAGDADWMARRWDHFRLMAASGLASLVAAWVATTAD
jgi:hypothetical protein